MADGKMYSYLIIDDEPFRVYCGPSNPVRGKVQVKFVPGKKQKAQASPAGVFELFGPIKIEIIAQGNHTVRYYMSTSMTKPSVRRGEWDLLPERQTLYEGPIRLREGQVVEYPFEVRIPSSFKLKGHRDHDSDYMTTEVTPPSMKFSQPLGVGSQSCDAEVRYWVETAVRMTAAEESLVGSYHSESQIVQYERAPTSAEHPPQSHTEFGYECLRDRCLANNNNNNNNNTTTTTESTSISPTTSTSTTKGGVTGFRARAAAFLKPAPVPRFTFSWEVHSATHVHRGEALKLRVRIIPEMEGSTVKEIPDDMEIVDAAVTIDRRITAAVGRRHAGNSTYRGVEKALAVQSRGESQSLRRFTEANGWTLEHVFFGSGDLMMRATGRGPEGQRRGLCSSFQTKFLEVGYELNFRLTFSVAGQNYEVRGSHGLVVHPPLQLDDSDTSSAFADAAISTTAGTTRVGGEGEGGGAVSPTLQQEHPDSRPGETSDPSAVAASFLPPYESGGAGEPPPPWSPS
jgi:hypothetical protein